MLTSQFIGLNLYFSVNILAALVAFAVFWLIFDAWTERHSRPEMLKWAGFLVVSLGFLVRAATIQPNFGNLSPVMVALASDLRLLGYIAIAIGQLLEPLQQIPHLNDNLPGFTKPTKPTKPTKRSHAMLFAGLTGLALALAAFGVAALYWRRATTGLERHLRPVALGFIGLSIFELINDAGNLATTSNPNLYLLTATYGPLWWCGLVALAVSSVILGRWVWRYLVKRLQSQLFMLLVIQTLAIFLVSTIGFTFLLLRNAQNQALADLTTASHVLNYAVNSLQAETAAQAEAVANNSSATIALENRDHAGLAGVLDGYLAEHNLTTLNVTDASAQVMLRASDPNHWGDSVSADPLVRRALIGETPVSVVVTDGVIAPTVTLTAARPIRDAGGNIIGTITSGRNITGSFVDGIRSATSLDSSVYGANIRSATTLAAQDGSRAIGVKETSNAVNNAVLKHGRSYSGLLDFGNRTYLASYVPLKDINNTPVGMLLVARPADILLSAATQSIQFIFIFVVMLIMVSVYPIYRVAKYLSQQIR